MRNADQSLAASRFVWTTSVAPARSPRLRVWPLRHSRGATARSGSWPIAGYGLLQEPMQVWPQHRANRGSPLRVQANILRRILQSVGD